MNILNCDELFKSNNDKLKNRIEGFSNAPKIATIRVSDDPGSISYEKAITNQCKKIGVDVHNFVFESNIKEDELINVIEDCNKDTDVNGILLFRPLDPKLDEGAILNHIDHKKDVDGCTDSNRNRLFSIDSYQNLPATAVAICQYLKSICQLKGKKVLIINRSFTIGIPLFFMLLKENATVEIAHSKSLDIEDAMKDKDIIVTAVGRSEIFKPKELKKDAIIVDMGFSYDADGKITGDMSRKDIDALDINYMPSIGGIGKLTRTIILENVCDNFIGD